MNRRLCLFAFLLVSFISSAAERLPRLDLLKFRDSEGKVQAVKTSADWAKRRAEILKGMVAVMGPLPGKDRRVDLAVQVEEEVDAGKYIRRLITYQFRARLAHAGVLVHSQSGFKTRQSAGRALFASHR